MNKKYILIVGLFVFLIFNIHSKSNQEGYYRKEINKIESKQGNTITVGDLKFYLISNPYEKEFKQTYEKHPLIPKGYLEAISYSQTKFNHSRVESLKKNDDGIIVNIPGKTTLFGFFIDQEGFSSSLNMISNSSGYTTSEIEKSPLVALDAYAITLSKFIEEDNLNYNNFNHLFSISKRIATGEIIINENELHIPQSALIFLMSNNFSDFYNTPTYNIEWPNRYKKFFEQSIRGINPIEIEKEYPSDNSWIKLSNNKQLNSPCELCDNTSVRPNTDYPSAYWPDEVPYDLLMLNIGIGEGICQNVCGTGSIHTPNKIAMHKIHGSLESGILTNVVNCNKGAHYYVSENVIIQAICENFRGEHLGGANTGAIGIEHEGCNPNNDSDGACANFPLDGNYSGTLGNNTIIDNSVDFYMNSTNLVRNITDRQAQINKENAYIGLSHYGLGSSFPYDTSCKEIKAHHSFGNSTWCNGANWDWFYFFTQLNDPTSEFVFNSSNDDIFDSGGINGNYMSNEYITYEISGNSTLNIEQFNLNEGDFMWIYDSPNPNILPNPHNNNQEYGVGPNHSGQSPVGWFLTGNIDSLDTTTFTSNNGGFKIYFISDCVDENSGYWLSWNSNIDCSDTNEPNNIYSQATQLPDFGHNYSSSNTFNGCINQINADIDWYRINLASQGKLTITLSSQEISFLHMDWLDNGNTTFSTLVNGDKQIVICSDNGSACYDTGLRIYTVNQNGNEPIPYTLDIQWIANSNQNCSGALGKQSETLSNNQLNALTLTGNTDICEGLANIISVSGGSGNYDWLINGQSVNNGNNYNTNSLSAGQYNLLIIDLNDVCSFAETQLNISSDVTANAGSNVTIQNGGSTTLQGSGGSICSWSPTTGLTNPNSCSTTASPSQTTTYTLTVTENGCTDTDTVTVTVNGSGGGNPPANDDCNNAITLTSNTNCNFTNGTVKDATQSLGANNCLGCDCTSPDDYDVYYKFIAIETSHTVTVSNYASNFDAVIELRTSCSSGSSNYISCYDPIGAPSSISKTWNGLNIGQTYYIRVFEWDYQGTPPNSDSFDICVTHQNNNTNGIDLVSNIMSVSNDNPDAGNQITVNYTITNNGDEAMTADTTTALYLSTNQDYDASDLLLSGSVYVLSNSIFPNGNIGLASTITIPNVSDGQYYIISYPDLPNIIIESDNNNNTDAYPIQIGDIISNGPDLDVRDVDVIPISNLIPGQEVAVEVRIENEGTEDVGSFEVLIYFDINGNNEYDAGNEYMGEFTFNPLDAGDDQTMSIELDLPVEIFSTGNYEIFAIADSSNSINETNENNNDDDQNVTIGYVYDGVNDDVRVIDETIDITNVNAGGDVFVTSNHIYLGSQSDADVPTLDLGYYLSTDCELSAYDVFLDDDSSGIGNDDPIKSEDQTLTIPVATPSGTYYVLFVADNENEISEGILENNNVKCIQITVNNSNSANGDVYLTDEVCNPIDVMIGNEIEPYANVHYTGSLTDAELPSVAVYYFLSNDCVLSTDDILVSDDSISLGSDLPVNDASDAIQLPNNLSPGTYYIIFQADAENDVFEIDESNNTACVQFNLFQANANYQDVTLNNPYVSVSEAELGEQVYVSVHQNYTGYQSDAELSNIRMEYYLSTDCMLSTDDYYFTYDVSSLGYDDPSQFEFTTVTIPTTISAGVYYILFVADTEDIIVENNENNNLECIEILIQDNTLSVNSDELDNAIQVYPNPTKDILNIGLGRIYQESKVEIFNTIGQKIYNYTYKNKQHLEIETKNIAKGLYFINVKTDNNKVEQFKIIKE